MQIRITVLSNCYILLPKLECMNKRTGGVRLIDKQGNPIPIPKEGSLSLLALGYQGIMAWRELRELPNGALIREDKNSSTES